jgi:hypothetical protein
MPEDKQSAEEIANQIEFDFKNMSVNALLEFTQLKDDADILTLANTMARCITSAPKRWGDPSNADNLINKTSFTEFMVLKRKFLDGFNASMGSYDINDYVVWDIHNIKTADMARFHEANQRNDYKAIIDIFAPHIKDYPKEWGDLSSDDVFDTFPHLALRGLYRGLVGAISEYQKK